MEKQLLAYEPMWVAESRIRRLFLGTGHNRIWEEMMSERHAAVRGFRGM